MFDRINFCNSKEYVPYTKNINVVEKKAPTDESIRLYQEMKEKAENSLFAVIEVRDNVLNFDVLTLDNYLEDTKRFLYRFILNGKEYKGEVPVHLARVMNTEQMILYVRRRIAAQIGDLITKGFISDQLGILRMDD